MSGMYPRRARLFHLEISNPRFRLEQKTLRQRQHQQLVSRMGTGTRASGIAHDISLQFLDANNMGAAVNVG